MAWSPAIWLHIVYLNYREHLTPLLADDTGLSWDDSLSYTAFSYADWLFDGDDIVAVLRTA